MKFGVGLFTLQSHKDNPVSLPELYKNTIEQVRLAEKVN